MYDFVSVQVHMILATGVAAVARSVVRPANRIKKRKDLLLGQS